MCCKRARVKRTNLISILEVLRKISSSSFTSWRIGLGSNRRVNHQIAITNRAVSHPNYGEANQVRINDIAIIFLNQPAQLSESIFPIFLPPLNPEAHPFVNVQGMVLGFAGADSVGDEALENLQAAHVRAMPHQTCIEAYPNANPTQHFCGFDNEMGSNFCLGDQVINF